MDITDWGLPSTAPKGCMGFQCTGSGRFYLVRAQYQDTRDSGTGPDGQPHQIAEFNTYAMVVDSATLAPQINPRTGMVMQRGPVLRGVELSGPVAEAATAEESKAIYVEALKTACNCAAFDLENMLHKEEINAELGL